MNFIVTYIDGMPSLATKTARIVRPIDADTVNREFGSNAEIFGGWEATLDGQEGTIDIRVGRYRTPMVYQGVLAWESYCESRNVPNLSDGALVVVEIDPRDNGTLVWCPIEEWSWAADELDNKEIHGRASRNEPDEPELRIIRKDEEDRDYPVVIWGGWLTGSLHTFRGQLPREFDDDLVIQRREGYKLWSRAHDQEGLFVQLARAPHAHKAAV